MSIEQSDDNYNLKEWGDWCRVVHRMSIQTKAVTCDTEGGPADCRPVIVWLSIDNESVYIAQLPMPSEDELDAPTLIAMGLNDCFHEFGKPRYVGISNEALMKKHSNQEEIDNFQRGDLQREFEQMPSSTIQECLSVVSLDCGSGTTQHTVISYKYDDKGMPEFNEVERQVINIADNNAEVTGAIMEVLCSFYKFVNAQ